MAKEPVRQNPTRKHLARLERERIQQRYLLIGFGIIAVLVIGVILFGILDQTVIQASRPVAKVGSETISTSAFQKEVRFQRFRLIDQLQSMVADPFTAQFFSSYIVQIQTQLVSRQSMGQQVLDSMIEDALVRMEAQKRGIEVTDTEADQAFQEAFGYFPNGTSTPTITLTPFSTSTLSPEQEALFPPTATPNPTREAEATITAEANATAAAIANATELAAANVTATPTMEPAAPTAEVTATATSQFTATPAATATITPTPTPYTEEGFRQNVATYVANVRGVDYSENDLRQLIRRQLLRQKVYEAITSEVEESADQVWARHILVATEEEANQVIERLNQGETFADLAAALSTDESNKNQGGDLGWLTKGTMDASFDEVAFTLGIGEISEPILTTFGYRVLQVLGRETRPMDDTQLNEAKQQAYQEWLDEAKTTASVETYAETWQNAVPDDPQIPAELAAILQQISSQQNQGLPIQGLPQP